MVCHSTPSVGNPLVGKAADGVGSEPEGGTSSVAAGDADDGGGPDGPGRTDGAGATVHDANRAASRIVPTLIQREGGADGIGRTSWGVANAEETRDPGQCGTRGDVGFCTRKPVRGSRP